MAATRPWWHEIVAGLSTERTPAARAGPPPLRPAHPAGPPDRPPAGRKRDPPRSPGGVITRKIVEWDPGSPAMEWVRRATFDGRAIAIRREQDKRARRTTQTLGITPLPTALPPTRASSAPRLLVVPRPPVAPTLPLVFPNGQTLTAHAPTRPTALPLGRPSSAPTTAEGPLVWRGPQAVPQPVTPGSGAAPTAPDPPHPPPLMPCAKQHSGEGSLAARAVARTFFRLPPPKPLPVWKWASFALVAELNFQPLTGFPPCLTKNEHDVRELPAP
ncbi:hypothetical protein AB1Y20_000758 [Prymnesium parvum]|uniref:Uncharacterized protein n=1 Tax=Prymnesium parvum TaxID=97485 RepID=A0AB34KA15_PRYPA